jgi:hypothetical protein
VLSFDDGSLVVSSNDPVSPRVTGALVGSALYPELEIDPEEYDFGDIALGCAAEHTLLLRNVGDALLVIDAIAHVGTGFSLGAIPALPLSLEPGEEAQVVVQFTPADTSWQEGRLFVDTNEPAERQLAQQEATGVVALNWEEHFWQGPWNSTDVLFYVDQSGSMGDDLANLEANFEQFTSSLELFLQDYTIMVATGDDGCHNAEMITEDTPDAGAAFAEALTGPAGAYTEKGLTIAARALAGAAAGGCNEGFLQEGSKPLLILVSDEAEQSYEGWSPLVTEIQSVAPEASISAIAGDYPEGCVTAAAGFGYYEASVATGGEFLSICSTDWGSHLRTIAESISGGVSDRFALDRIPNVPSITVTVDGVPTEAWTWDAVENAVVFDTPPAEHAHIAIQYTDSADCGGP